MGNDNMGVTDLPDIDYKNLCYMNQERLMRAGVKLDFTQEQINEIKKCAGDIDYFVRNYVKITTLDNGVQCMNLRPYQEEFINTCFNNRFVIAMMARQMGKTTTVMAYLLHQAITRRHLRIAVLANKGDTAKEILDRIKQAYEELPYFLQVGVKEWNKNSITLGNGTKIIAAATSSGSIRGKSCHIVYLDEFAHIDNDLEFYTSTYPVISSGKTSQVIITSTPNGLNLFYKLYTEALEKRNNFVPLFYDWKHNADIYDDDWEEATRNNMSPQQFAQEYSCEFQGSASTLLSGGTLQRLTMRDPLHTDNKNYYVYEEPNPDKKYIALVDVAEGTGNDSSVVSVFDVTTIPYRHVAMYRNNLIQPIMLADIAFRMAKSYNDAWLGVESNSIGNTVTTALWYEYEYENMICYDDKINDVRMRVDNLGIRTTKKSKAIGCSRLKSLIETDTLITNDVIAIREFGTFTEQGGVYKADKGKHDDVVMTFVLFALLSGTDFFKDMFSDANKTIKDAYKSDIYENEPFFMIVVNGVDDDYDYDGQAVMYR